MSSPPKVRGCCPLDCQDTCAWEAQVQDGRVVRVTGAKDHPITRGSLCVKVSDYQERTYALDRLLHPLRRTGPKGSGQFERITWDEAASEIAQNFRRIIQEDGPEALVPIRYLGSMGAVQRQALLRFFHALGASRVTGSVCGAAGNVLAAEGHPRGLDPEDFPHAELIVLWGANILTTSHHQWHFIQEARKRRGARIIAIDPRRTRTADRADVHLAPLPGSDAALAAGIAHILLAEGLADLAYAKRVVADLDAFAQQVSEWTPERTAAVCGLEAQQIVDFARAFGSARPALIRAGIAPQQTVHGEAFVRSLSALAVLGGHWRRPGGGLYLETGPEFNDAFTARPDLQCGESRVLDLAHLGEVLTSETLDPPVRGLMVWGANPAVHQPDAAQVWQGLERKDLFMVVIEHFLTDTARFADIVLPSTTQLEHFDIQGSWGHHYISVNHPAVPAEGEAKTHGEILRLLSAHIGLTHPALFESDEQIAASALPDGVDLEMLKARGWVKRSPQPEHLEGRGLHLCADVPLPPTSPQADALHLLTPKAHYFLNSSFSNMPRQRRAEGQPTLDMNPDDALKRGLTDGRKVSVGSARGALIAMLRVTDAVRPGVVVLPGKWWAVPDGAAGNLLTPSAWSPGGQPAYNDTFVTVEAVRHFQTQGLEAQPAD